MYYQYLNPYPITWSSCSLWLVRLLFLVIVITKNFPLHVMLMSYHEPYPLWLWPRRQSYRKERLGIHGSLLILVSQVSLVSHQGSMKLILISALAEEYGPCPQEKGSQVWGRKIAPGKIGSKYVPWSRGGGVTNLITIAYDRSSSLLRSVHWRAPPQV